MFTNTGKEHILKLSDVPYGKFRDKGTPIDNLCNYDSREETVLEVLAMDNLAIRTLLFVTRLGMVKRVLGDEFDVGRRTVQACKLSDGDELLAVKPICDEAQIVLATGKGFLLRFGLEQIPYQKKTAMGVRGIRLDKEDVLDQMFLLGGSDGQAEKEAVIQERKVTLSRLRIGNRDTRGTRLRKD